MEIQQLQEELIACKLREAEASLSMKEMQQRVFELQKSWKVKKEQIYCVIFIVYYFYFKMNPLKMGNYCDIVQTDICS